MKELNDAALKYAKKHSSAPDKETPDWIIIDFKAGANWMQQQLKIAYWAKRLTDGISTYLTNLLPKGFGYMVKWKEYSVIKFTHGYAKDAPSFEIELLDMDIKTGNKKWGAEHKKEYFVLSLGKILSTKNIK